jgi:hypothetical protein
VTSNQRIPILPSNQAAPPPTSVISWQYSWSNSSL